jgi:ferrous iron transport protein B
MIMTLLYVPCVAVLAAVKRETNSWKWPIFMVLYTTGIAWILSVLVYQSGILFGW